MRSARRLRLRFDEAQRNAEADLPAADQPARGARLGARPARLDRSPACARRTPPEPFAPGAMIPIEGGDSPHRVATKPRRERRASPTASCAAAAREAGLRAADRSCSSRRTRSRPCRARLPSSPLRQALRRAASAVGDAGTRWGSCSSRRPDPAKLAADPRAARGAPLRRRARGRAPRPPQPRPGVQGARGAAVRARTRRGEGELTALGPRLRRIGRRADWLRLAAAAALAGAAVDGCGGPLRLLRRERLVELLLRRLAGSVGPDHRLLLRIAVARAAACRSACHSRRPSAASRSRRPPCRRYISSSGVSCQSGIGTWVSNCSTGRLATATVMKSWKARAGAVPPWRPRDRFAHRRGPSTRRWSARSKSR